MFPLVNIAIFLTSLAIANGQNSCQSGSIAANNTLGSCECDGQLWINDDCTKGYYCDSAAGGNDFPGCAIECETDEILIVDPRNGGSWECKNKADMNGLGAICPGKFHTECPCTGANCPSVDDCECEGQLRINQDCTEAVYCNGRGEVNETKTCPAGEIVMINVATQSWSCGADDQRCPGAFSVGCEPTLNLCDRKANPYGDCCGAGQLWINDDCSEGFYCDTDGSNDGCSIKCREGDILLADPRNGGSWRCISQDEAGSNQVAPIMCPGKFNTECACSDPANCPIGDCECTGQLRINHDCHEAKYCNIDGSFISKTCGEGEIVFINVATNDWFCGLDDGRCPGAFQVGCDPSMAIKNGPGAIVALIFLAVKMFY